MSYQIINEQDLIEGDILVLIPKGHYIDSIFSFAGNYYRVVGGQLRSVRRKNYYFDHLSYAIDNYIILSTKTRPRYDNREPGISPSDR